MLWSALFLILYMSVWAAVHSLLASLRVKAWARRAFGPGSAHWYRLAYNSIAAATFLPLLVALALLPDRTLYTIPAPWRALTMTGQALTLLALVWSVTQTGPARFAGWAQLLSPAPADDGPLQVGGFYCYVRHPLYTFSLVLIWLMPVMTVNLATLNALIALYFWIGSRFEEDKLLQQFGEAYAEYRRRVPRFVPRLRRCQSR